MYPDYIKYDADNYVYQLKSGKISEELQKIGLCHYTLIKMFGDRHIGFIGNVVETADLDNDLNLIVNVTVCPNNTCEENMLADNFDKIKQEQLPDLEEIHFDGGYGGSGLEEKREEHKVKGIQTAIKGVNTECRMQVIMKNDEYYAICADARNQVEFYILWYNEK